MKKVALGPQTLLYPTPVVMVGEEIYGKITPARVSGLIKKYRK